MLDRFNKDTIFINWYYGSSLPREEEGYMEHSDLLNISMSNMQECVHFSGRDGI